MNPTRRPLTDESGFTLLEVIVAVVLLGIIMPSISLFFVSSIKSSATLQRRDAATQLADEAMDLVRAVPAVVPGAPVSSLVKGRTYNAVDTQWRTAPAGLETTAQGWDTTIAAGATGVPVVPLTVTRTVGQQQYVIDTFIGTCGQAAADPVCSDTTTNGATFHRIVVRVAWSPGPGATCSGVPCEFLLTTVVNGNNEPLYNTSVDAVRPVARADDVTVVAGQSVEINVLTNDTGASGVNPVTIMDLGPAHGDLFGTPPSGTFTYTPDDGFTGTDPFEYRLSDNAGLTSDPAVVTVRVIPPPAPVATVDSVTVVTNQLVTIAVLGNDTGTLGSAPVTIVSEPSRGTLDGNRAGGTFTYRSQSGFTGTDSVEYRLTDRYGQTSGTAVVTVQVIPPSPPPVANAGSWCVVHNSTTATGRLSLLITGTTTGGTFTVTRPDRTVWRTPSEPTPGDGEVSIPSKRPPPGLNNSYPMPYTFTDAYGRYTSNTVTLLVKTSCP